MRHDHDALRCQVAGILKMRSLDRDHFEARLQRLEQAILELDAAFRRSGLFDGSWALSLPPSVPDRQSAGATSRIEP